MIYVMVEGKHADGCAGGNTWHDTSDVAEAAGLALASFHEMWDRMGYGEVLTYRMVIATEASPNRTSNNRPLPIRGGGIDG